MNNSTNLVKKKLVNILFVLLPGCAGRMWLEGRQLPIPVINYKSDKFFKMSMYLNKILISF